MLTAGQDNDFENDTETLWMTASGGGFDRERGSVDVTTIDDDEPALVVSSTSVTIDEGGTVTFWVRPEGRPSSNVEVDITGYTGADLDTTASTPRKLTFSPSDWDQAQTVTIGAKHDGDEDDDSETLTLTATGGSTDTETINVTIIDDDFPHLVITPASVIVDEEDSAAFTVMLDKQPSIDAVVEITGYAGTDLDTTASAPRKLTFSPSDWDQAQTVTIGAKHDGDFVDDQEILTLTASGASTDTKTVTVDILDDDSAALVVDPVPVTVAEGGSESYMVKLAAQPSATVTVATTGHSGTDLTLDETTLTFNPSGSSLWSTAQTVTLTAAEDDDDFADDTVTLTLTASKSGGYNGETANIEVTIKDNDVDGAGITVSGTATVTEGSTTIVDVNLAAAPKGDVTVTFSDDGDSDVSWLGTALTGDDLTFTATNWNVAQTVTLMAQEDDDDFVNDTEILTLTAKGGGYSGETANIEVTIKDNDVDGAGITVPNAATVTEGSITTVDVTLAAAPKGDVAVTFGDDGDSDLSWSGMTLSSDALTFTTENWNVAQTITLTAAEDNDDFVDDTETLTLTAKGGGYSGETANIEVTIEDNDVDGAGITVPNAATVTEGSTTTVDVKLAARPKEDVTVTFSDDGDSDVSWSGTALSGNALTFTPTDWNVTQAVTLTAAEDDDFVNDTEILTLTAKGGGYDGVGATIHMTIVDDDTAPATPVHVRLSASPNPVEEGNSVTVWATLSEALPDAVTINLRDTPGEPPTEPGDYGPLPRITIAGGSRTGSGTIAIRDDDISEGAERFTVAITDDLPSGVVLGSPSSVEITIADNDPPPPVEVTLSASPNPVDEGNPVTITARLTGRLETNVVVPLAYPPSTAEPGDYSPLREVTILRGETQGSGQIQTFPDADMENETFIVALGGNLPSEFLVAGRESSQSVTIRDVTSPTEVTVVLSASPNPVDEGNGVTVTATLSEAMDTDVVIPLTLTDGTANAQDYQAPIPVQVEIEAGKTNGTYRISTLQDDVAETDETFTVALGVLPSRLVAGIRDRWI